MRTDGQIKQDILDELAFQPNIDETQIGVVVKDGVVTLKGLVFSYATKTAIVKIIEKVAGVKAIAEGIKISYMYSLDKTDTEIANAALNALEWNASVPNDKVIIEVDNGWITLLGELERPYQKDAARRTVEYLEGVKGVSNNITLKQSTIKSQDIKKEISKAFERMADINANNIVVDVDDGKARLRGKVNSLTEKNNAQQIAHKTIGVLDVQNELEVIGISRHIIYDELTD